MCYAIYRVHNSFEAWERYFETWRREEKKKQR